MKPQVYICIGILTLCTSFAEAKLKGRYLEHPEHYDVPILGNGGEGEDTRLQNQQGSSGRGLASHSLSYGLNIFPFLQAVATKTVENKHQRIERPQQVANRAPSSFNKYPTPRQTKNLHQRKPSNSRKDGRRPYKRHGRRSLKRFTRQLDTPNLESGSASKEKETPDSTPTPLEELNVLPHEDSHESVSEVTEEVVITDAPNLEEIFKPVPGPYMRNDIAKSIEPSKTKTKTRYGIYSNWDEYLQAQRSAYLANLDKTKIFEDTGYKPVVDPDEHFRFVDQQFKAKNEKVKAFHNLYISLKKQFKPFIVLKNPDL